MKRNETCSCNSGEKFKNCCLLKTDKKKMFQDKIKIVNSYQKEDKVVVDFLYDWLPYQLTYFLNHEEKRLIIQSVVHHVIYNNNELNAFKIYVGGTDKEYLRIYEDNYNEHCPFCLKIRNETDMRNGTCPVFLETKLGFWVIEKLKETIEKEKA